ncbi:MAG: sulfate ABC transporter permease subunit CysT [Methylococcales bacterium]|nr:sulfate ABC transporter permease subunit CysT [Methylococcales bacterium]
MTQSSIMPGFRPALAFTLGYLTLIVLIPLSSLLFTSLQLDWNEYLDIMIDRRVLAAFRISFLTSLAASVIAGLFGFVIAWVMVRYPFAGKRVLDALIDLPFALPTAVAGVVLATIYQPGGIVGKWLIDNFGLQVAYTPLGIVVALIFIGIPFVVRTIEPVLQEFDTTMEEAAACLGASRLQVFAKIILPNLFPAVLTGVSLAFARGIGEYGSVIFIAGNLPYVSEIAPLLIVIKLEQYQYAGATSIAFSMLIVSFLLLLGLNLLQRRLRKRSGQI